MGIRINPDVWRGVFAVPTAVTDEHLRRASGQQLKVLLYVLRHNGEQLDRQAIAEGTGMTPADAADALQYWVETGFLFRDETESHRKAPASAKAEQPPKKKLVEVPSDVLPTYETVADRMLEDPQLPAFFNEVQSRLGKTIGYDTQARLLMLIDSYGLPPEVVLTIVEYAVSHGKTSMAYICKVGKNWAEDGIDSLEKAEERLQEMNREEALWKEFVSSIGADPPHYTRNRSEYLRKWRKEYGQSNELICYAYEEMINNINKINFRYMDKILENWHDQGLRSPTDVVQEKKNGRNGVPRSGEPGRSGRAPSYDSDLFRKKATGPIEYKRKGD